MKKILLSLGSVAAVVACGSGDDKKGTNPNTTNSNGANSSGSNNETTNDNKEITTFSLEKSVSGKNYVNIELFIPEQDPTMSLWNYHNTIQKYFKILNGQRNKYLLKDGNKVNIILGSESFNDKPKAITYEFIKAKDKNEFIGIKFTKDNFKDTININDDAVLALQDIVSASENYENGNEKKEDNKITMKLKDGKTIIFEKNNDNKWSLSDESTFNSIQVDFDLNIRKTQANKVIFNFQNTKTYYQNMDEQYLAAKVKTLFNFLRSSELHIDSTKSSDANNNATTATTNAINTELNKIGKEIKTLKLKTEGTGENSKVQIETLEIKDKTQAQTGS